MSAFVGSGDGKSVSEAPLIAGKGPLSFDEDTVDNLASATVPVKLPAGILVSDAPEPLKVVAVTTPALPNLTLLPTLIWVDAVISPVTSRVEPLKVKFCSPTIPWPPVDVNTLLLPPPFKLFPTILIIPTIPEWIVHWYTKEDGASNWTLKSWVPFCEPEIPSVYAAPPDDTLNAKGWLLPVLFTKRYLWPLTKYKVGLFSEPVTPGPVKL